MCQNTLVLDLVNKCKLLDEYLDDISCNVPRHSYRYVQFHALGMTYEVQKSHEVCSWIKRYPLPETGKELNR
jgi:hypothetical protein